GITKSKSMDSEEIELAHALEHAGIDVVETDLGEFIVQISKDRPSHIVAPIIHKNVQSIAKLFSEYFNIPYTEDPQALTAQARKHLRDKFRRADLGMTGGNFLIAETAQVSVVENEGNPPQSLTPPPTPHPPPRPHLPGGHRKSHPPPRRSLRHAQAPRPQRHRPAHDHLHQHLWRHPRCR